MLDLINLHSIHAFVMVKLKKLKRKLKKGLRSYQLTEKIKERGVVHSITTHANIVLCMSDIKIEYFALNLSLSKLTKTSQDLLCNFSNCLFFF